MGEYGSPENPYIITIPGWDDIVKIHPKLIVWRDAEIAKQDWGIYFSRKKAGTLDDMPDQAKRKELDRRVRKFEQLAASPTPSIVKSIGKYMTYVDDTEDLLSTALVAGKILRKRLPFLAVKAGTRFIPALGWALLAADILEIGNMLWKWAPIGRKGKKRSWDVISGRNFTKRGRLRRVSKFMARKPGVPELIEAAQATTTLFGTGLQIGPLLGAIIDPVFGLQKLVQGKSVKFFGPELRKLYGPQEVLMEGLAFAAYMISSENKDWRAVHMLALTSFALGIQNVQTILNSDRMIQRSNEVLDWELPHITPWEPMTREILKHHGIDPDRDEPHTFPSSPNVITYRECAGILREGGERTVTTYRNIWPTGVDSAYVSTTMIELAMWMPNADLPYDEWDTNEAWFRSTTEVDFVQEAIEIGIRPVPGTPVDKLIHLVAEYKQIQEQMQRTRIGEQQMRGLIVRHLGTIWDPVNIPQEWPF